MVDNLANGDFMDLEDTFCRRDNDWESNEELQDETDQLLRIIYSELLVRKRLLLAEELI